MKLYLRLLLNIPFIWLTYIYIRHHDPDEFCSGMMDIIIYPATFILLIVCCILARIAIFSKRKNKKPKAEPVSLFINLATLAVLLSAFFYPGHTHGHLWIEAKSVEKQDYLNRKTLTLKQNGNFTLDVVDIDVGCTFSGSFKKSGDTILFDDESKVRVGDNMCGVYIISKNRLIPLLEKDSLDEFNITVVK